MVASGCITMVESGLRLEHARVLHVLAPLPLVRVVPAIMEISWFEGVIRAAFKQSMQSLVPVETHYEPLGVAAVACVNTYHTTTPMVASRGSSCVRLAAHT